MTLGPRNPDKLPKMSSLSPKSTSAWITHSFPVFECTEISHSFFVSLLEQTFVSWNAEEEEKRGAEASWNPGPAAAKEASDGFVPAAAQGSPHQDHERLHAATGAAQTR
jgi:hypothetical protein